MIKLIENTNKSEKLKSQIEKSAEKYMKSEGFDEDEIPEYLKVEVKETSKKYIIVVHAEVSFDGLEDLCDILNKIITKYDKESYFEPVTTGIIEAYVSK